MANICTVSGMAIAWAIVTTDDGVEVIGVVEVGGVLVDARTGAAVDLVSLVVVDGLAELVG